MSDQGMSDSERKMIDFIKRDDDRLWQEARAEIDRLKAELAAAKDTMLSAMPFVRDYQPCCPNSLTFCDECKKELILKDEVFRSIVSLLKEGK